MRVIAIIQARMGSTRLPGKVLLDLAGEPMLVRDVSRVKRAETLNGVVIATTMLPPDDAIVALCSEHGWDFFRGSEEDVLDRYYRAAIAHSAEAVVRITSDCPLIDPGLIDRVVQDFIQNQSDAEYASNIFPERTFPRGLETEVIRFDVLEKAWREDCNPAWREHVTPYIQRHPERFGIRCVTNSIDFSHLRWTVDTPEDLELVKRIYDHFVDDSFSWLEALALLERFPQWSEINRDVEQKSVV
jgi:spore coat polysaccharide biosynthesis protein SpsF